MEKFHAECARSTSALYDRLHSLEYELLDMPEPILINAEAFIGGRVISEADIELVYDETLRFLEEKR